MDYTLGALNKALINLSHRQIRKEDEYAYNFWEERGYIQKIFVKPVNILNESTGEATVTSYVFTDLGKKYINKIDPPPPRNIIQKNRIE